MAILNEQNYFPIDYDNVIANYIYEQFKESPNLLKYIEALSEPIKELQQVFIDILNYREVQNAFGKSLDVIGDIVGQPRPVYDANSALFFGFVDTGGNPGPIAPLGMGTLSDNSIGGIFRFVGQPSSGLTIVADADYRTFIATQIETNTFEGHINALLKAIESFLYSPFVTATEFSDVGAISDLEPGLVPFAFSDVLGEIYPDPHAGFGDALDPSAGGGFLGNATSSRRIYVRITENFDLGSRGIQIRFYARLSTKLKSFIKLNDILPKIAGIRYTYQDDNGIF